MNNVLLDELPTEWNGYEVNTWFQIGIQISLIQDDDELSKVEKAELIITLLFSNDDGTIREYPTDNDEFEELLKWFIGGWFHDRRVPSENDKKKLIDYDIDQWRIYSDFLKIYRINLNESDMHWWMFQGLLWNMPGDLSSFMQVIDIRTKKPSKKATPEEKKAVADGHRRYDLKQRTTSEKEYTKEEIQAIDEFDRRMAEKKARKNDKQKIIDEALKEFQRH